MASSDFLSNIETSIDNEENPIKQNIIRQVKVKKTNSNISGGYRPVLVDENSLKREADNLESCFKKLNQTKMNDQDKVSFYIITYLNYRYPNQLFQNRKPIITDTNLINKIESKNFSNLIQFNNKNVQSRLESKNMKTFFDLVNNFNLNSVPYSARYTLVNWYLSFYDDTCKFRLNLFINQIPSSLDVLKMQSNGERCVSLIYDKIDSLIMEERDPLSFLLHDLVHAYKMFSNSYLLKGQIGFCKAILKLFNDKNGSLILNTLIQNDKKFADEFDYLISDMNSHPKHLFYYFKAILIFAFKRRYGLDEKSGILHGESLLKFNQDFELFLNLFEMNQLEKDSCHLLLNVNETNDNIKPFNLVDFTIVDNFFIKLYEN